MPGPSLKSLLGPRSASFPAIKALWETMGPGICVIDPSGKHLLGEPSPENSGHQSRTPIQFEDTTLGFVIGPSAQASALATLLTHLAARDSEGRALASEVLHLYREVHLIEQLSEQLAAILNLSAVAQSSLAQAQRLISATHGSILVIEKADDPLRSEATFGPDPNIAPWIPGAPFAASILDRGIAEIVNNYASDPRALKSEQTLKALICAPLAPDSAP